MKCKILHDTAGRLRVHLCCKRMTLRQADVLEYYLLAVDGVRSVKVYDRTRDAVVVYDAERECMIRALARFSFEKAEKLDLAPEHTSRTLNREFEDKLALTVMRRCASNLFLPAPVTSALAVIRSAKYIKEGLLALWHRKLSVAVLDATAVTVSMVRGDFATAGSVMFLLQLGELLEEWTHKKSVDDLARTMSLGVSRVWLQKDGTEVSVPLSQIASGDRIVVRTGSVIPFDGEIVSGEVAVNQASLTGESVPVIKRPGAKVFAGTVIEEGDCVIEVTQQAGESRYDKIVSMIEQSEQLKSAAESRASHLADKLVPYTLAGSVLSYALTRNVTRALSVLMVDFSCALKLAMPLAVLSAMREASTYHVTVKGGKFLEALSEADTIVFDKTGTLTHACPVVADVIPFGGREANEMLRVAACLEEHFPHSMANAVVRAAKDRSLAHEEMHSEVQYIVAHGISSTVNGEKVVIGSAHFVFEDESCTIPEGEKERFDALDPAYSHLYLAVGGELAAVICISDPLREEACAVMRSLRALGIRRTVMLTGDSERTAKAIAEQVGVDDYRAEVLPEDKASFVEAERRAGRTVIMIGDGINDSPALSAANVGIAISDGAAIAREIADVTIAAESLFELVALRRIAQHLMRRIHANYRFVIGFNGSLIGLGVAGILMPATSAMLHNLSTVAISLRSMTNLMPAGDAEKPVK